jgi:hypothetical protein
MIEIETKVEAKATLPAEVADQNKASMVTVTFRTFSHPLQNPAVAPKAPTSLSFLLKFYDHDEMVANHALKDCNLCLPLHFTHPASFSFVYDYSSDLEEMALYLMEQIMTYLTTFYTLLLLRL